jgi:hypothetical protein
MRDIISTLTFWITVDAMASLSVTLVLEAFSYHTPLHAIIEQMRF